MVLPKLKRHLNAKNALSDHDNIHGHRNLNYTERSMITRHWNFNAPKICKITVSECLSCGSESWAGIRDCALAWQHMERWSTLSTLHGNLLGLSFLSIWRKVRMGGERARRRSVHACRSMCGTDRTNQRSLDCSQSKKRQKMLEQVDKWFTLKNVDRQNTRDGYRFLLLLLFTGKQKFPAVALFTGKLCSQALRSCKTAWENFVATAKFSCKVSFDTGVPGRKWNYLQRGAAWEW